MNYSMRLFHRAVLPGIIHDSLRVRGWDNIFFFKYGEENLSFILLMEFKTFKMVRVTLIEIIKTLEYLDEDVDVSFTLYII